MSKKPLVVLGSLIALGFACGAEPTKVVTRPHPLASSSVAVPQPPHGAKWVFVAPESGVFDKLDLADGSTLYVGEHGRRELIKDGVTTDAPTLAPDTLSRIIKDDQGRYVFLTDEGDTYVAREPLGAFEATRKGPTAGVRGLEVRDLAIGRSAMFVVLSDGRFMRSTDYGVTWKAVDYAASKAYGHPSTIGMDRDGHGLLIHIPQRVYLTQDDGATWAPIAAPATGARWSINDADRRVFIAGWGHKVARLEGNMLIPTDDLPKDFSTALSAPEQHRDVETVRVIAGDHVVELETRRGKQPHNGVVVRSSKLGERPASGVVNAALGTNRSLQGHVAAFGSHVAFLRADDTDENTPTSTVMRSEDYGATWKADITLEGTELASQERLLLAAGPRGWAFVGALCGARGERHEYNCSHRQVRAVGAAAKFEDLAFTEEFRPRSFAFDERHDKVYALGDREWSKTAIYESALSQNKFKPVAVPFTLSQSGWLDPVLSVDDEGTVRVFTYDGGKAAYEVQKRDAQGKALPTVYLPHAAFTRTGRVTKMVFAGSRGVLFSGDSFGWETADGGESWSRVGANGAWDALCSDAGCATGETQRIGWDLPSLEGKGDDKIASSTELPETPDRATSHDIKPAAPASLSVACKLTGAERTVKVEPGFEHMNDAADVRWAEPDESEGKVSMVVGGRTSVRELRLLDVPPKTTDKELVRKDGTRWVDSGFIAARYAYKAAPEATYQPTSPVDVELGWFSLETGRAHHGTLPKLEAFRIASQGITTGDVEIVKGGLAYQSTDTSPLYFIHDDGKVERMTLPSHATVAHAVRIGTTWLLHDTDDERISQLSWSMDNGKTWQQRTWALADNGGSRPEMIGTWLGVSNTLDGTALFALAAPLPTDLPTPVRLDLGARIDAVCDAKAAYSRAFEIPVESSTVTATLDPGKNAAPLAFTARRTIAHLTQGGAFCTSGYSFSGSGSGSGSASSSDGRDDMVLYRDASGGFSGWSFRRKQAQPVTCR